MDYKTIKKVLNDPLQEERRNFIFNNLRSDYEAFLEGSEDYTYEQLENILKQSYKLAKAFKKMFKLRESEQLLYNQVTKDLNN